MGLKFQSAWSTGPVLIKRPDAEAGCQFRGVRACAGRSHPETCREPGRILVETALPAIVKKDSTSFGKQALRPRLTGSLLTTSPEMQLEGNDRLPHSPDLTIQMFVYLREMNMTAGARCLIRYGATKSRGFSCGA
jgi:hypothetical protein